MKTSRFLATAALVLAPLAAFAQAPLVVDNFDTNLNVQGGAPLDWSRSTNATGNIYVSTNPPSLAAPFTSPNAIYYEDKGDAAPYITRSVGAAQQTNLYRVSYSQWVPNYYSNASLFNVLSVSAYYRSRLMMPGRNSGSPLQFAYTTNQLDGGGQFVTVNLPDTWIITNGWNSISWGNDLPGGGFTVTINSNTTNFAAAFTPDVKVKGTEFRGGFDGAAYQGYGWLDNVALIAVPEPGALPLALSAAGLLLVLRRRA